MKRPQRIWLTPAFLLHQHAYRDTSRIVEFFTREHGRISLFARGARVSKSSLHRGLRPFQRLLISWSGRGEAGQLTAAEPDGPHLPLPTSALMSGFYLNELIMKLTERWDANAELFDALAQAIVDLSRGGVEAAPLRRFEKRMLEILGYGTDYAVTESGEPVSETQSYWVKPHRGVSLCLQGGAGVSGRSLLRISREMFDEAQTLRDAKHILRASIDVCLEGRPLRTREVLSALVAARSA